MTHYEFISHWKSKLHELAISETEFLINGKVLEISDKHNNFINFVIHWSLDPGSLKLEHIHYILKNTHIKYIIIDGYTSYGLPNILTCTRHKTFHEMNIPYFGNMFVRFNFPYDFIKGG